MQLAFRYSYFILLGRNVECVCVLVRVSWKEVWLRVLPQLMTETLFQFKKEIKSSSKYNTEYFIYLLCGNLARKQIKITRISTTELLCLLSMYLTTAFYDFNLYRHSLWGWFSLWPVGDPPEIIYQLLQISSQSPLR